MKRGGKTPFKESHKGFFYCWQKESVRREGPCGYFLLYRILCRHH